MSTREATQQEYQTRILKVLVYIQEHLDSDDGHPIDRDALARVACFSPYHFHRIFSAFVGESLHQYIRRLRLERAASLLLNSQESITDVALRAGYETPAAFGKAFKQQFNASPTQFREERLGLIYQLHSPQLRVQESTMLTPTIKELSDQPVYFVRETGNYGDSSRAAWGKLFAFAGSQGLPIAPPEMFGISHDSPSITEEGKLRYDACIPAPDDAQAEGEIGVQTIHGGRYAVFVHEGSYHKLHETYQQIFSQWLPHSDEELREQYCFERYLNMPNETPAKDLKTEIFIPLA